MRPLSKVAVLPKHQVNHRHSLAMLCAAACNAALLGVAGWTFAPQQAVNAYAPAPVALAAPAPAVKAVVIEAAAPVADSPQIAQVDKALRAAVKHASAHPMIRPAQIAAHRVRAPKVVAKLGEKELLAQVMWHEARGQGRLGMLATGIVTMNRVHEGYNGRKTLSAVVNEPYAYTWVKDPQAQHFNASSPSAKAAMDVAGRLLSHRLLADEQQLANRLGHANHFHAVTMAKYPRWAFSAKLERVKFSHAEEVALGAVFYAPREGDEDLASR
jgi:hypothetical protein